MSIVETSRRWGRRAAGLVTAVSIMGSALVVGVATAPPAEAHDGVVCESFLSESHVKGTKERRVGSHSHRVKLGWSFRTSTCDDWLLQQTVYMRVQQTYCDGTVMRTGSRMTFSAGWSTPKQTKWSLSGLWTRDCYRVIYRNAPGSSAGRVQGAIVSKPS